MNGVKTKLDDANRELVRTAAATIPPAFEVIARPTAYSATAMKTVKFELIDGGKDRRKEKL